MKTVSTQNIGTDSLKILIYGESGSGKTTLAGTVKEPALIISAEAGLLSLAGKNIDTIDITQNDEGQILPKEKRIDRLREVLVWLLKDEARKKYKWVFVDSLTEVSQYLIDELRLKYPDAKNNLQMYGENKGMMRAIVKAFRDLSYYNVVFTALPSVEKDENGRRFFQVDVVGSIAQELPAMFDEVLFLQVAEDADKKPVRQLVTGKTGMITAKDRSGKLALIEPANLDEISKKIKGGK